MNLRGIRSTARANEGLLAVMSVVIVAFMVLAIRYLFARSGWQGVFALSSVYNPETFQWRALGAATSLAALTYIGFDGVTTLAEEVRDPKRTVPLATVLVCLITGVLSAVEIYLAQRVWPDYNTFRNIETAFFDVAGRVGGPWLFQAMAVLLIIACLGSGLTGQAGAARLLLSMGRDRVLPSSLFGHVNPRTGTPTWNVLFVGALALASSLLISYEHAAELLNFGAFLAFMGVNLAAIRTLHRVQEPRRWRIWCGAITPTLGFLFCLVIWLSLPTPAKIAGGAWITAGLVYAALKTRGFRVQLATVDFNQG